MGRTWAPFWTYRSRRSAHGEHIAYVKRGDSVVMWRPVNSAGPPTAVVRSRLTISTFDLGKRHGHVVLSASNDTISELNDIFVSPIDSLYRAPGHMVSARFSDGPSPAILRRDTLFRDSFLRASGSVNYDVFPGGKSFVMLRTVGGSSLGTASPIVVITNWRPSSQKS